MYFNQFCPHMSAKTDGNPAHLVTGATVAKGSKIVPRRGSVQMVGKKAIFRKSCLATEHRGGPPRRPVRDRARLLGRTLSPSSTALPATRQAEQDGVAIAVTIAFC